MYALAMPACAGRWRCLFWRCRQMPETKRTACAPPGLDDIYDDDDLYRQAFAQLVGISFTSGGLLLICLLARCNSILLWPIGRFYYLPPASLSLSLPGRQYVYTAFSKGVRQDALMGKNEPLPLLPSSLVWFLYFVWRCRAMMMIDGHQRRLISWLGFLTTPAISRCVCR